MVLGVAGSDRFAMVKQRHLGTLLTALRQGKVDEQAQGICEFVASTRDFYTSSCCSGRIVLLEKHGRGKHENFFHRKWHREILESELLEALGEEVEGELWFKLDPFILHIGCKTIENAKRILSAMREAGVKRGGIILAEDGKFLIEMQGTDTMSLIIASNGKPLVGEGYLLTLPLVEEANKMLRNNYYRLEKLGASLKKHLAGQS